MANGTKKLYFNGELGQATGKKKVLRGTWYFQYKMMQGHKIGKLIWAYRNPASEAQEFLTMETENTIYEQSPLIKVDREVKTAVQKFIAGKKWKLGEFYTVAAAEKLARIAAGEPERQSVTVNHKA